MTVERLLMEVVRLSSGYLASHGSSSPRLDAELLAAHSLGLRRIDVYLQHDRPLDGEQLACIRELVRHRGEGAPVAYLVGEREFYGRAFAVTPDVLIPRPETECLVDLVLRRARGLAGDRGEGLRVADLGTGSGCIGVTLAAELPGAEVVAVDVDGPALDVARRNARRHAVDARVELVMGSWCEPLTIEAGRFDLVVSNPPYLAQGTFDELPRDVRDHEPRLALDGGRDGLDAYRALLPQLDRVLAPGGWIALEIDPAIASAVVSLAERAFDGPVVAEQHRDLGGARRVLTVAPEPAAIAALASADER